MKYIYHIEEKGSHIQREHSNIDNCMNELMQELFKILGNGDSENGGAGSLWRCAQSIYDTLKNGGVYVYADCKFWVEFVDEPEEKTSKYYVLRYSAVVHNSVTIEAENREELEERRKFWEELFTSDLKYLFNKKSKTAWHYDGNINNEGEEEIK